MVLLAAQCWLLCAACLVGAGAATGGGAAGSRISSSAVLGVRGGAVPQAKDTGADYYEQFHLDYGSKDNKRFAGALRGFIAGGKLQGLPESDPFFKWLNEHLESGPEPVSGRLKPFYAADFGSKKDLKAGENPKVIIVQRKLEFDQKTGVIAHAPSSSEVDVEVREIWQPWLKRKCDFVARYIVPSRVNIIKIMEAQGRFVSELEMDEDDKGRRTAWAKMTFKPTLAQRLAGKRDVVLRRQLDASKLPLVSSGAFASKDYAPGPGAGGKAARGGGKAAGAAAGAAEGGETKAR